MGMRTKTFDCVEMKNRIQAERMAEYEAHKSEYTSFAEFIRARTERSEWIRTVRKKIRKNK